MFILIYVYIIILISKQAASAISLFENSQVQINSKLKEKNRMITYTKREGRNRRILF